MKMNLFSFEFFFGLMVGLSFLLTFYIYFRLLYGVIRKREVPQWIYKFGQAFQGRVHIEYENATNSAALRDANLFLFLWLLVYSTTNAVRGAAFFSVFLLALYVNMQNFRKNPWNIAESEVSNRIGYAYKPSTIRYGKILISWRIF